MQEAVKPGKEFDGVADNDLVKISPFNTVDFEKGFDRQAYRGTVASVISELESALIARQKNPDNTLKRAMHPSRLVRGVMDYFIDNRPDLEEGKHEVLQRAVKLSINANNYNPRRAIYQLERFKEIVHVRGYDELLSSPVVQIQDKPQWDSTDPHKSLKTAKSIIQDTNNRDILLIPLGHGGVPAGIDVYNFYTMLSESESSIIYPVRFSRLKKGDKMPRLTDEETVFLKDKSQGRQAIIFDEDTNTGETLIQALGYFQSALGLPRSAIITKTNLKIQVILPYD